MRRLAAALALALVSTSLACGLDRSSGPSAESMVGTWNLATVNGVPLPWVYRPADPKLEILGDQFITLIDGTFTETLQVRTTDSTGTSTDTLPFGGRWTLQGARMYFQFTDGTLATATAGDGSFTFATAAGDQVFVRQ